MGLMLKLRWKYPQFGYVNRHGRQVEYPGVQQALDVGVELQPELEDILRNAVRALGGSAAVVATWDDAVRIALW